MYETLQWGIIACPYSKTIGFIRIGFINWDLWSFSQGDLLQNCSEQQSCMAFHVSLIHLLGLKIIPKKLQSMKFLEHLQKFNLDICKPRYINYPQVSYLGMNPGRGWNPNLEGSYLPEYSEYEAEFWKHYTSGNYIRARQFSAPDPSPILGYSDCTEN